ncbi:MAG TPA: hypothetical protein VFU15_15380 [Bacteroidia bacterium]|nr:hypothetical protein [Bacteroidia bacterium]
MTRKIALAILTIGFFSFSCNNGPGPGGKASITGKVWAQRYVNNCTLLAGEYWDPDEDVYIIYGDDPSYGDRIKTGPDGTFQFNYLREGKYTVYAYSNVCSVAQREAVKMTVEITGKKQNVQLDTLKILK